MYKYYPEGGAQTQYSQLSEGFILPHDCTLPQHPKRPKLVFLFYEYCF